MKIEVKKRRKKEKANLGLLEYWRYDKFRTSASMECLILKFSDKN